MGKTGNFDTPLVAASIQKFSPRNSPKRIPREKLRQGERRQMGRRVSGKKPVEKKKSAFPLQVIQ